MNIAIATNWTRNWNDSQFSRAGSTVGRKLGAALKAVQYAQMIAVMNRLPEDHLEKAGLRRADIPEQARQAIYGEEVVGRR